MQEDTEIKKKEERERERSYGGSGAVMSETIK